MRLVGFGARASPRSWACPTGARSRAPRDRSARSSPRRRTDRGGRPRACERPRRSWTVSPGGVREDARGPRRDGDELILPQHRRRRGAFLRSLLLGTLLRGAAAAAALLPESSRSRAGGGPGPGVRALMRAASRVSRAASRAPASPTQVGDEGEGDDVGATPSFGTSRERSVAARRHASGVPRRWSELRARLIMLAARPRADALARDVADARPRPRRRGSSSAASSRAPPPPPPTRARSVSAASASSRPLARATCAARAAGSVASAWAHDASARSTPRAAYSPASFGAKCGWSAERCRASASASETRSRDAARARAGARRGGASARARARADEPARRRPHPRACPPARRPTPRASRGAAVTATRGRGRVVSSVVKAPGTTRAMTILFVGTNDGIRRGFPSRASASSPSRTRHRLHSRDTLLVHGVVEDPPPPPFSGFLLPPPSSVVSLRLRAST